MFKRIWILFAGLALLMPAQTPVAPKSPSAAGTTAAPGNDLDSIIELVKGGMSESLLLKTIQRQGKVYNLTPEDMLKLQKAGVSEIIIGALMDPNANSGGAAATTPAPAGTAGTQQAVPGKSGDGSAQGKKKNGFFSAIGDGFGKAARDTVDSTANTVGKTAQDTTSTINKDVGNSANNASKSAGSGVGGALGVNAGKAGGAGATASKPQAQPATGRSVVTAVQATTPGTPPAAPAVVNNAVPALTQKAAVPANPVLQLRQRYSSDMAQAGRVRNSLVLYERRIAAQHLQVPADLSTSRDTLDTQMKAAAAALIQKDQAQIEKSLQDLEATSSAAEKSLASAQGSVK